MSAELVQKIELSKQQALSKGTVIKMRKEDVTKNKLRGVKFSYSWYQTPSKVGIEIPFIVEKKEDLKVKFTEDKVTIDFPIKDKGENYHLDLVLFRNIIPVRSKAIHRLDRIEIVMEKKQQSDSWAFLRRDGLGIPEAAVKEEVYYPSSSKVKKNWDKIDKEIEGDILQHGEEYGEDPSMNFFKQIFANGDEEKRRAMMKSFQTSGGTVLSTDWNDVSKKDYEGKDRPSPPKGQEWKKR